MIKVNDRALRIALPAIPCGLFLYEYFSFGSSTMQANVVYILTVILVCELARSLIYRSRSWFKRKNKYLRFLVLIPCGFVTTGFLFVASKALRNYMAFGNSLMDFNSGFTLHLKDQQIQLGLIGSSAFYGMIVFLVLLGIYELAYHFARLNHMEKQRNLLEREKLKVELQQLKGIVNPHFLFNNLNSLSSLISENPAQAEDFLDELTRVFRYLLRNNETELTEVTQELQFIHSYFHLLQTRYGNSLTMNIDIEKSCESYLLPPLTLQLLVENVVKHNRINKNEPLTIEIFSNDERQLVVRNNILTREQKLESTGIGLRSINSRYDLLEHEHLTIIKDENHFSVIIPLIPSVRPAKMNVKKEKGDVSLSFQED